MTEYWAGDSGRWVRVDSEILGFDFVDRPGDLAYASKDLSVPAELLLSDEEPPQATDPGGGSTVGAPGAT